MPFGDPRPLRRRSPKPLARKAGPGQKGSTKSGQSPSPNPVKVGKIVADCLEVTPRLMNPLEVTTGARLHRPDLPQVAILDVLNREDGLEYQILVMRKPSAQPEDNGTSTSSR